MVMTKCAGKVIRTRLWVIAAAVMTVGHVMALSGPNVCTIETKYNITKRVKYRAPMSVRTYEWCLSMPPRCSRWRTEMRDLTRLESEERTAEVAICCAGYKMKEVSCVPICPNGRTGKGCTLDCPLDKWGPNCAHACAPCVHGKCSGVDGRCVCHEGWEGESCQISKTRTVSTTTVELDYVAVTQSTTDKVFIIPSTEITTSEKIHLQLITPNATTDSVTTEVTTALSPKVTEVTATTTERITSQYSKVSTSSIPKKLFTNVTRLQTIEESPLMPTSKITLYANTTPTDSKKIMINNLGASSKYTTLYTTEKKITTTPPTTKPSTTDVIKVTWKPERTVKPHPTTLKFNPKEIWIKPAQKGEKQMNDTKSKLSYEMPIIRHLKNSTKKEVVVSSTTPRTIIVSIIPTSLSYSTFKKISLTTASSMTTEQNKKSAHSYVPRGDIRPISTSTSKPIKIIYPITPIKQISSTVNPLAPPTVTSKSSLLKPIAIIDIKPVSSNLTNSTPSMTNEVNITTSSHLSTAIPVSSTNVKYKENLTELTTAKVVTANTSVPLEKNSTIKIGSILTHNVPNNAATRRNANGAMIKDYVTKHSLKKSYDIEKPTIITAISPKLTTVKIVHAKNDVDFTTNIVTRADEDETFHVLTEPEHITAVIDDKGTKSSTLDLISVFSIAVGVMMSMITVAVIIVMIDRCKRSKYDDVRKSDSMRLKEMDNRSTSPQYIRSIFHTPLPDPPSDKSCHYQPISTLDRNLKQFMRPVVVQTLSPIMIENFRGILECHYDHLPRRSGCDARCSIAPSTDNSSEPLYSESTTETDIEALKCEARQETLHEGHSEPLYAEIPCWRPPVQHAIEILNINNHSEAVTEL